MNSYNQDNRSGGGRSDNRFGGRDSGRQRFGGRDSGKSSMHKAICDECGKECEVPFLPTGDKPVYCSKCFESKGNISPRRSGGRDSRRSSFDDKQMFQAVCNECGRECEVPFRPTSGKPVFCSRCFEKRDTSGEKKTETFVDEFQILNSKLDKILQLLNPFVSVKPVKKKEVIKEKKAPEPEKLVKKTVTPKKTVKKKVKTKKVITKKEK